MLIKNIASLVKENPSVRPKKKSTSGKKPVVIPLNLDVDGIVVIPDVDG
ncbi:MAG: hypothetical protein WA667_08555 [Candidatus Nitrosopolaris sp.]